MASYSNWALLTLMVVVIAASGCSAADVEVSDAKYTSVKAAVHETKAREVKFNPSLAKNRLRTLMKMLNAAGLSKSASLENSDLAWTILAPTDVAFTARFKKDLGITPAALMRNDKNTLTQVLMMHTIPTAALQTNQLTDGQTLTTVGGETVTVSKTIGKDGQPVVEFVGPTNIRAKVVSASIKAGNSIIHVIDDVLLPAGVGKQGSGR